MQHQPVAATVLQNIPLEHLSSMLMNGAQYLAFHLCGRTAIFCLYLNSVEATGLLMYIM